MISVRRPAVSAELKAGLVEHTEPPVDTSLAGAVPGRALAPTPTAPIEFRAVSAAALRAFTEEKVLADTVLVERCSLAAASRLKEVKLPSLTQTIQNGQEHEMCKFEVPR